MRLPPETEEEKEAERKKFLEVWEKIKVNSPFWNPKVPDEEPRED